MRCMVCGNEMDNTLGGCYTCFHCGHSMHDGVYRPPIKTYVKQVPYVDDEGIWIPYEEYVPEGCESNYRLAITKEMFIEAYNKWIKE